MPEDQNTTGGQPQVGSDDLLAFLRGKLADAEKALRCREEMANAKPLTDDDLASLAKMPGVIVTKGRKLSKAAIKDMEEEPRRQKRIAIKCRHEVDMFTAAVDMLKASISELEANDKTEATAGASPESSTEGQKL